MVKFKLFNEDNRIRISLILLKIYNFLRENIVRETRKGFFEANEIEKAF